MKTVLVLEDDALNLRIFTALLLSRGRDVLVASTALEAFSAADGARQLDLLVADVRLKGDDLTGTDVAVAIARRRGRLPVVFVCGTPLHDWDEQDRRNMRLLLRAGVEVLEKPFTPAVFDDAIERALAKRESSSTVSGPTTLGAAPGGRRCS